MDKNKKRMYEMYKHFGHDAMGYMKDYHDKIYSTKGKILYLKIAILAYEEFEYCKSIIKHREY